MIAIVGAGVTGLALAWHLERLGADFVVLEAATEPGGVVRSSRVEGRVLDAGPQRTRLTRDMAPIVAALGLEERLVTAPDGLDLFVYRGGTLVPVPFSLRALAASRVVSPAAKVRLLLEPLTGGPRPDERVSEYFVRKVGREVYDTLVAPLYGGLYASDPADMDVDVALAPVLERMGIRGSLLVRLARAGGRPTPRACSFVDGMQELPRALHRAVAHRVRLGTPVRSLRRNGAGQWRLSLPDPLDADHVVLTTSAAVTANLVQDAAPALADAAGRLRYNALGVVHLHADTDLVGLGFQVSFTERDRVLRGVTYNDSLFGRDGVYTAYLGGARSPGVAGLGDAALSELARSEFRICTGFDARTLSVARAAMPAWDRTWRGLSDVTLPPGLHVASNWWSRPGLPGRFAEARRLAGDLASAGPAVAREQVA